MTVLGRSVLPAGVRPLGAAEGFSPLLPPSITLHHGGSVSAVAECGRLHAQASQPEALSSSISTINPAILVWGNTALFLNAAVLPGQCELQTIVAPKQLCRRR